jgi:hypothetical protein
MKQFYFLTLISFIGLRTENVGAQTIWTGPTMTFAKANNADWTLEANQDRLTSAVWITRANNRGIFNIVTENGYSDFSSPSDTEWAIGTTANLGSLTFQNWEATNGGNPPGLVNKDLVVHLITDDIYIDIKFTFWQSGGTGGGFSYDRSTDQSLSTNDFASNINVKIFPNPATEFIQVSELISNINYSIFNVLGEEVKKGTTSNKEKIDINNLNNGLYLFRLDNGITVKFIKK